MAMVVNAVTASKSDISAVLASTASKLINISLNWAAAGIKLAHRGKGCKRAKNIGVTVSKIIKPAPIMYEVTVLNIAAMGKPTAIKVIEISVTLTR